MFDLITCLRTVFTNILAKKKLDCSKTVRNNSEPHTNSNNNAQAPEDMTTAVPDRLK